MAKYHVIKIDANWQSNTLHNVKHQESVPAEQLLEWLEQYDSSEVVSVVPVDHATLLVVMRSPNQS